MTTGIFLMKECLWKENQGVPKVRKAKRANWPMLYDDDCMAACECLGIHDTKSAELTFRSFM